MLPKSSHPLIWSQKDFISSSDTLSENPVLIWIQNSFSVARKLLKDLRREAKTREDWLVRWNCSYCRFTHSFSRNQSCPERVLSVLKTTSLLGNSLLLASLRLLIQSFFFCQITSFLFEFQQKIPTLTTSARMWWPSETRIFFWVLLTISWPMLLVRIQDALSK